MHPTHPHSVPAVAIVESNTLAAIGLKQLLQSVMPMMQVHVFGSFEALESAQPEQYFHFFASVKIVLSHMPFFLENQRKTIVLTTSTGEGSQLGRFHTLCTHVPEAELIRSLLQLEQHAHPHGKNLPPAAPEERDKRLSPREIEVLALVVQGLINKEIADRLHISLTTVISHRKNIAEKLGTKSVSAMTIYAVMHGYVDIERI